MSKPHNPALELSRRIAEAAMQQADRNETTDDEKTFIKVERDMLLESVDEITKTLAAHLKGKALNRALFVLSLLINGGWHLGQRMVSETSIISIGRLLELNRIAGARRRKTQKAHAKPSKQYEPVLRDEIARHVMNGTKRKNINGIVYRTLTAKGYEVSKRTVERALKRHLEGVAN